MALNKTSIVLSFIALLSISFAQAGLVKGTVVKTSSGYVPIEELNIGDTVYCFDTFNDEFCLRNITDVLTHEVSHLLYIQTNGAHIIADAQQPFYLPVEDAWCYAEGLQPDMVLLSYPQQRIMVQNVNKVCINALVYDITVDELHDFCVTTDGIVVHNFWIVIPLTLSLSKIAYSLGVAAVAYVCYDFMQKNIGASIDPNIDLSHAHFSNLIDPHSSQTSQHYGHDGTVHKGNESSHANVVFASNQSQESNCAVPTHANKKLPQSPSVHDTRSFPIPKIESEKILGCGTGLLPTIEEFDENKPTRIQEIDTNGGRTCGTGLLMPVPETNLGRPCEISGSKDDDGASKLPTCGNGLLMPVPEVKYGEPYYVSGSKNGDTYDQLPTCGNDQYTSSASSIDSTCDQGVVHTKKNQEPKAPDSNGAQAPGMPEEKHGFEPPKNWDGEKVRHPKNGKIGWPDKYGYIWVPSGPFGHGGLHWDVQSPKGKKYDNVYPNGKIRPGRR